jgi:peptide deformylase
MAREPIVQVGARVLRAVAEAVAPERFGSPELAGLADRLAVALEETPGVGVAAPQIGVGSRVVLVQDLARFHETVPPERLAERERVVIDPYVMVNPELEAVGTERRCFFEGCLSVAGYVAAVERAHAVRVRYRDLAGEECVLEVHGWHARILQHEVDHLNGVLYVDRMTPRTLCEASTFQECYSGLSVSDALVAVAGGAGASTAMATSKAQTSLCAETGGRSLPPVGP